MKPILLEVSGFGPFVEHTVVDFTRLGQTSLFLVYGPTGAGKTTLFDAVSYALYGETSGRRKSKDMVSDYDRAGQKTSVSFTFGLGEKFYRANRSIQTDKPDKVSFETFDKDMLPIAAPIVKITDMRTRVEEILGFTADQFQKVIMLPQGEFEKLLVAETGEREKILTKLFDADIYSKISLKLAEKADAKKKELAAFDMRVKARLETLGLESVEEIENKIGDEILAEELLKKDISEAENLFKKAREQREIAERTERSFGEYEAAQTAFKNHEASGETLLKEREKLRLAELAEPLNGSLQQVLKQRNTIAEKTELQKIAKLDIEKNEELLKIAEREYNGIPTLRNEIENLRFKTAKLEEIKPKLEEKSALQTLLKTHSDKRFLKEKAVKARGVELETLTRRLAEIDAILPQTETLAAQLTGVTQILDAWRESARLRTQLRETEIVLQERTALLFKSYEDLEKSARERDAADRIFNDLDKRWRRNQAALLAEALVDDEPCPVCGSHEHPAPAEKTNDYISTEQLERAKAERENAGDFYERAKRKFEQHKAEKDETEQDIAGFKKLLKELADVSEEEFLKRTRQLEHEHKEALAATNKLEELRRERQQKNVLKTDVEAVLKSEEDELQEVKLQEQEVSVKISSIEIPEAITSLDDVQAELLKIAKEIVLKEEKIKQTEENFLKQKTVLTQLEAGFKAGEESLRSMNVEMEKLLDELRGAALERGFKSTDEVRAALLPQSEREFLKGRIQQWDENLIRFKTELERTEKAVSGLLKPQMEIILKEEKENETALQRVRDAAKERRMTIEMLEKEKREIQKMYVQQDTLLKKAAALFDLSEMAKGNNALKQKFQTFVVSSFLDEILQHANQRLKLMSQGRYTLVRSEEIVDKRRKTGLDLNIFDNNTGEQRPVDTLSGGEKFYTSLALALGLADVATAHAGGRRLESMFIDEGFGTLDANTLDLAIQTLMDLQEGGRLVGIISHVEGLKERVPVKLEVVKRHNGSFLKWHGVAGEK
jgi:exonuclease SbcC